MYTLPTEPLSIGRTLDSGIKLFLASFKDVIGLSVLMSILLFIPQTLIVMITDPSSGFLDPETGYAATIGIGLFVLYIVILFVYGPMWVAITTKIWAYATNQEFSLGNSFWRGIKLIPRLVLVLILTMLALMGGSLLLIIPGIYLLLSLSFSYYLIIIDDLKALQSLKTSHSLVKGHWWRTAAAVSVPIFMIIALYGLIGVIIGIYFGVSGSVETADVTAPMVNHIANLISGLVGAVFTPFMISLFLVIMYDLKLRNEGTDLMNKLQAMKNSS